MESVLLYLIDHFPDLMDINLTASVVILFVICVRQFLKGAPKIFSYALWGIVLLRLLVPVSIESPMSFVPERTEFSSMVEVNEVLPELQFETPVDRADNEWHRENTAPGEPLVQTYRSLDAQSYLTFAWLAGMAVMLLRGGLSYWRLRRKLKVVIPFRKGIFLADDIASPFVMGIIRPRIYLPGSLEPWERTFIIAHERHHICRGDHIWKALGYLALTVHWFNPFVWAAFVLAGRDMEMSCDEAVIRKLGEDVRGDYSASLLNLATGQRMFAGTPLAFGEGDPTGRVLNLAKWKKPALWVILICLAVCVLLAVCLLTDPASQGKESMLSGESIAEMEQYCVMNQKQLFLESVSPGTQEDAVIAIKFYKSKGPQAVEIELQYMQDEDVAWTVPGAETLTIGETCAFRIPAGSQYRIYLTADGGQGGNVTFQMSDHGIYSLSRRGSRLTESIELTNAHNGKTTYITDENSIADICAYLDNIAGADWGSSKGYYEGSYSLKLHDKSSSEYFSVVFGDTNCFFLGQGEDGYPVRYELIDRNVQDIVAFLSRFDSSDFRWPLPEQTEPAEAETLPEYQNWAVSTQVHDVTPEHLILTYHNELQDPVWRLPGYTLQRWQDGRWKELDVGKTWNETTEQVDFAQLSNPQNGMYIQWDGIGTLPQGQYLIGQRFCTAADSAKGQQFTVYASFEITGESGGIRPLEELPELYSGEQAMLDGCFVSRDGEAMENIDAFRAFAEAAARGEAGFIRIVDWYYGDNSHFIVRDLSFDGSKYTVTWLQDGRKHSADFRHLKHFTGEKEQANMAYDAYEHYVLVNDNALTWPDIWEELISDQYSASIDHMRVFSDYIYYPKTPDLPGNPDYAVLELKGSGLMTVTDGERLEKLIWLFENGEYMGYEPKTHSIGVGLNLIFAYGREDYLIELDPDSDLCRINGEYVWYGKADEPDYILKLWEYLGITQWPDMVYTVCENAMRP